MAELWERHRGEAFARLEILEQAAATLAASGLGPEAREDARAAAHKLRGSAGTFGRHRASEIAGELEELLAADGPLGQEVVPTVASLVLSLRTELEAPAESLADSSGEQHDGAPSVLLVSDSDELRARLESATAERNLHLSACGSSDASDRLAVERPDLVLLELIVEGSLQAGLGLLGELAGSSSVPVMVLAASDQLVDRVEAARRGARGFLDRGLDPATLLDAVERFAEGLRDKPATVLAVDDDESALAALRALLGRRGFRVETLSDPTGFWERLEAVAPDLAIIDLDMPQISGIDLCRTIRADARWTGLPLLILTAYRDPELVGQAFEAGADDYISKPIIEEELVSRVRNRLGRIRAYREASGRDELTGVASRRAAAAAIDRLLGVAARSGEPLAIALIDIDELRTINTSRGNAAGDALLRHTGARLMEEFGSDAVGRWDGDQFVIAMNGIDAQAAGRRVDALVRRLNADGNVPGKLSAGVAAAAAADAETLIALASGALDEAKRGGGARHAVAGTPGDGDQVDVVIVEDDDSVTDVLELALQTLALSWRRFDDGGAAIAELAADPPRLSARVVLLDWDLPSLDGLSVLSQLRDAGVLAATRVIMLTARGGEDETLKAFELGASDYVAKPFSVPVLVERLRRTLAANEAGGR